MSSNANKQTQNNVSDKQDIFVEGDPALGQTKLKTTANENLKPQKLAYLTDMLLELKKLASEIDEPMTAYLIEMAYIEATTVQTIGEFKIGMEE